MTLATAAVIVFGVLNSRGYGRALALAGATPGGAAALVGQVAIPTFYAVAVGAAIGVGLHFLQRSPSSEDVEVPVIPAGRSLMLLVAVAVVVTLVAPLLFNGLPVLSPASSGVRLSAGLLTKSNIAQIVYLVLSVCVVVHLARARWTGPGIVGTAACLATLLSFWSWSHTALAVPYPEGIFDNSPTFVFQETLPGGLPRVRGIFSEPAGLAASSLITIAYSASRLRAVSGLRRAGLLVVCAMAAYLGLVSTSATFFIAGIALAAIAAVVLISTFIVRGGPVSRLTATALCVAAVAALWVLPFMANTIGAVVDDKVVSASYDERSGADTYSYGLVWETVGIGTGLGSNRASSFAASLLSTVGIVGSLLLVIAVWVLIRDAWPVRAVRPVVWALVALLLAKVIAGPDLADSSGILWLSLGVLSHAAMTAGRARRHGVARRFPGDGSAANPGSTAARTSGSQ